MSVAQNNHIFNIVSENQIATILGHFNSDYIMSSIIEKINSRNFYSMNNPNVVYSYELNFQQIKQLYPTDMQHIDGVRSETYKEIIEILCRHHNLSFDYESQIDYYSAAFYLYDFLVSNFSNHIISFFVKYLVLEKSRLYEYISSRGSDRDLGYSKKIYKDNKIATISSNLDIVLDYIKGMDIPIYSIINALYPTEIANFLNQLIAPIGDFYKDIYVATFNDPFMMPEIVTGIKLQLQAKYGMEMLPPIVQN